MDTEPKPIALYHVVHAEESFETAATMLVQLVAQACASHPGVPRLLYLDIEGHRNAAGGYDADMRELQTEFVVGFLLPYLREAHIPLLATEKLQNPHPQRDDLPAELHVIPKPEPN